MSKKSGIRRLPRMIGRTWAMWACFISCLSAQTFRLDQGAEISFLEPPGTIPAKLPKPESLEGRFTLVHEDANPFPDGEYFRVIAFFLKAKSGKIFRLEQVADAEDPVRVATGSPGSFLVNSSPDAAVPSVVLSGSGVSPEAGYEGFTIQHTSFTNDGTWVDDPLTPSSLQFFQIRLYEYHLKCSTPADPDTCLELRPFAVLTFNALPVGEEFLAGEAGMVKYPIGAPLLEGEGEESLLENVLENYVTPRAFPAGSIDFQERLRAFRELESRRGTPHAPVGYSDTPLSPGTTTTGTCGWYSVGPTNINGRVTSIAIDPKDNQRIFVTTVGGIWRSKTGGRRWERVSDDFLSTVFASVAINPVDTTEVFAGAGDPNYHASVPVYVGGSGIGIWRSTAGGDRGTWIEVSPLELRSQVIARLRIDPVSPYNVYAATSKGVYLWDRSIANSTFARVGNLDGNTTDIAVDFFSSPASTARAIYAGVAPPSSCASQTTARGIWKWDVSRSRWNKKDSGIDTLKSGIISLSLSQSNPLVLYAKVSAEVTKTTLLQGIYKTKVGGEGKNAWTARPAAAQTDTTAFAWYNNFIEVDPTDANRVYTGSIDLWRGTNVGETGETWSRISAGTDTGFPFKLHEDQHALAFDSASPPNLYVANDGGLARTNYTSPTLWHWDDVSHGMVVTEFYRMTRQQATATVIAGGSQDNGTEISFGNQTWYNPYKCDGFSVAIDAANSDSLYATCNCTPLEIAQPVPYSTGGDVPPVNWGFLPPTPTNLTFTDPIVTDPWMAGAALSMATTPLYQPYLLRTTNGKDWKQVVTPTIPIGTGGVACVNKSSTTVGAIAIAPIKPSPDPPDPSSLAFKVYYIGLADFGGKPAVWRTFDGGESGVSSWDTGSTGLPTTCPASSTCPTPSGPPRVNAIVVDWTVPTRAYAGLGGCGGAWGSVYMTTSGGASWFELRGSGTGALPVAPVTGVAVNPVDTNVIYATSPVGVFKGTITTPPTIAWVAFDEGLPNGLDVSDIWVNKETKILSIGTIGHGAYERHIDPGFTCPGAMLLVRDNVFDRATSPSPSGEPDPEHPILDTARPASNFYKPDDTDAGKVYWWDSTDIRIDVPLADPQKNRISNIALAKVEGLADHVEFETCPIELAYGYCPAGTLWDSSPQPGVEAKFYVQVINRGLQPASNVRVIALWTDATLNLPLLPDTFWTNTFPSDIASPCRALSGTGWNSLGCKTIDVVNPEHPRVVSFDWNYPTDAIGKSCMMAMVESVSDPITVRAAPPPIDPSVLAPNQRQITVRNLHVIDVPPPPAATPSPVLPPPDDYPGMEPTRLQQPTNGSPMMDLVISRASMPGNGKVAILLPPFGELSVTDGVQIVKPAKLSMDQQTEAISKGLDISLMYDFPVGVKDGTIYDLPTPADPADSYYVAALYHPGDGVPGTSSRFALLAKAKPGREILGGSTYILRYRSPCDTHCLGLEVSGPSGNCPGDYTVRAVAGDDNGDVISYTFTATLGAQTLTEGPILEPAAKFTLGAGRWTLSVKVSDLRDPTCPQAGTDGICSETIEITSPSFPVPPTDVAAAGATKEVTVSWSAPACGAAPTGYRVLRSAAGASFSVAAVVLATDRSFTDFGLGDDTEYCYVVETKSVLGPSVASSEVCARTFGLMPPTNVTAASAAHQVTVSWSPASGVEPTGYSVLRGATDGSYNSVTDVAKTETSYTDVGLEADKEYCYVVRTKAGVATSVNSDEACAKTPPAGPTFRRGDVDANGAVEITDPVNLLGYLFLGAGNPDCFEAADTDNDGELDITDAVNILGYLFLGAAPPAPPGPTGCGPDPLDPFLGCDKPCP